METKRLFIPTKENYTEMTPAGFEQFTLDALQEQFQNKGIEDYSFIHDVHMNAHDGNYQIDGKIQFSLMGTEFVVLVECKKHKSPIKREQIEVLYNRIVSIGAHKGIFVTTSSFQSGALKYAKEHGIALISIIDGSLRYDVRSREHIQNPTIPSRYNMKSFSMAMQTQVTDTAVSVSYLDNTDALYQFIITKNDGKT